MRVLFILFFMHCYKNTQRALLKIVNVDLKTFIVPIFTYILNSKKIVTNKI